MERLTIGQFNDSFPPIMDGVGLVTKNYAYWLSKFGHKVYVITTTFPGYIDKEIFEVLRYFSIPIPMRPPYRYGIPSIDLKFKFKLSKVKFDIVHAHSPFKSGNLARKIAKKTNIPFVASFHTKYYEDFKRITSIKPILKHYLNKIVEFYNDADLVMVPNKKTIETLREYGYSGEVEVMYNGTDITLPDNLESYISNANKDFEVSPEDFVMLYIGQLIWEKNHELLIQSLKIIKNKGKNFKMIFIGKGYAEDKMKEMIKKYGLEKNVKFLGVITDREKIKSYYARANLFLFPSLYDTSPLTLRESAAFEVPVIMIKGATATEGMIDEYNSFLTENTPESFAEKIIKIMNNPDLIKKVGKQAKIDFYRTWETVAKEVTDKYLYLLKNFKK